MSKELYISSTPHETKVALVEEDQLAEIFFERENEYTLAGSIYKGRVTRVLPGMQSAFVDIGLERDAFLYVTDFMEMQPEDDEEFEKVPTQQGGEQRRREEQPRQAGSEHASQPLPHSTDAASEHIAPMITDDGAPSPAAEGALPQRGSDDGPRRYRGRRRRGRRGRGGVPENLSAAPRDVQPASTHRETSGEVRPQPPQQPSQPERRPAPPRQYQPIILPGESISKYQRMAQSAPPPAAPKPVAEPVVEPPQSASPSAHQEADEMNREASLQAPSFLAHYEQRDRHSESTAVLEETVLEEEGDILEDEEVPHAELAASALVTAPPRRPTEEIDVQAVLQQHAASAPSRAGVLEEEEIEEEEAEQLPFAGGLDDNEFEELELEEETLDRMEDSAQQSPRHEDAHAEPVAAATGSETMPAEAAVEHETEEEGDDEGDLAHDEAEGVPTAATGTATEATPQQPRRGFDRGRGRRGRQGSRPGRRMYRGPLPLISDLLKEGQEILVQIAKEPIAKKGARITSHIALPGRFLVYMPTVNHNGVSRKISSDDERRRLKRIIQSEHQNGQGGFIVRTAAASAGEEDLRADIRFLLNLWHEIKQRAEDGKSPALIYHDLNLVERILRDQVSEGFSHIWVDTEQEYERVLRFINRFQPSLVKRVKLYTKETPLFEQFNIQEEINKALKSKVWLKSGGYIVINQTEALVAIDVNTGKYVGKTQRLEDTIVKTNVDAIREIVRQIRLRDLGGIIVIDFIDMDERRNRAKVMQALEESLKADRAPSKVLQFNDFGLVAITRKRVKQSLERTLGQPCTYCTGTGLIKSSATICNEIYVEMRKMARHLERGDVILRVNPEVGKALKMNNARWLTDLEELTGRTVIVKPDPTLHQEQFDIH